VDRAIVYDNALPQSIDILNTNKFGLVAQGRALWAILGGNTVVHGLQCTQTSPTATLNVNVAPGSIYTQDPTDANAYGDLGIDNTIIIKQGIIPTAATLTITPPSTSGFSQIYLIEAALQDVDTGSAVLPYYNANNIQQPFSGPGNSGQAQFLIRQVNCVISLKAGVAAPTGTEIAPTADVGYVGLYTIDVPNGISQITNAIIKTLPTAPFFWNLPSIPGGVQTSAWTYGADTGVANAMQLVQWPPVTTLVPGQLAFVKAAFGNTGPATFALGSTGAQPIHRANGAALTSGDYNANMIVGFMWDGAAWQIINFSGISAGSTTTNNFVLTIPYVVDTGTPNTVVGTFSPAITTLSAGLTVEVQIGAGNTNTGASTLAANATGAKPIIRNGLPLQPRDLLPGLVCLFVYDGASWELINARWAFTTFDESSPPGSDLPLAVGDQQVITFTGVTTVPLKVASVPGLYEIDLIITACNSASNNLFFQPNNNHYANGFTDWAVASQQGGGPFNIGGTVYSTGYVYGAQPGISIIDDSQNPGVNWQGVFVFDMFINPQGQTYPQPKGPNAGPLHAKMTVSTVTAYKAVNWWGGCSGGAALCYGRWWDTSIAWTSLGTLAVAGQGGFANPWGTISGTAIVRRLA
jgi:hypothetical protein